MMLFEYYNVVDSMERISLKAYDENSALELARTYEAQGNTIYIDEIYKDESNGQLVAVEIYSTYDGFI